jgi:methyl-accepting chemotaxis protein
MFARITRFVDLNRIFFAKLSIAQQVAFIIGIMTIFLLIQGLAGVGIVNTMHRQSLRVFNSSSDQLYRIAVIQQDLQQFQMNYLSGLSGRSLFVASVSAVERVEANLNQLRPGREKTVDAIVERFRQAKGRMDAAVSDAGYQGLEADLTYIKTYLNQMENAIRNAAYSDIASSKDYSSRAVLMAVLILTLSVLLSIGGGLVIIRSIAAPLQGILAATTAVAGGDLSAAVVVEGAAEMRGMARGLNQAIRGLRQVVDHIEEQAGVLLEASKELKLAAGDTGKTAHQVAETMEELARAAADQSGQVQEAVETIKYLNKLVRKVTAETQGMAESSEKVAGFARSGQNATAMISAGMDEIYQSSQAVSKVINEINETSTQIGEITAVIAGIAEQTTLLSLNAAIEAARAGDQGKGFEVVADETGKLAEQSKRAARMIADLAAQMSGRARHAVDSVKNELEKVESGKKLTSETALLFEEIFQALRGTLGQIQVVARSAREMAEKNETSMNMITSFAALSEESMAGTEQVSAAAEEQSAAVEEVSALADNLATVAASLKDSVARFTKG